MVVHGLDPVVQKSQATYVQPVPLHDADNVEPVPPIVTFCGYGLAPFSNIPNSGKVLVATVIWALTGVQYHKDTTRATNAIIIV